MGGYFSSVNSQVAENVLAKSKLGQQAEPKWALSSLKVKRREGIVEKGVDPISVSAEDIAEGYEASVVKVLAGDLVSRITDVESGISIYRLRIPRDLADGVLSISLPEGVKNVHVLANEEIAELPEWTDSNRTIRFESAWGFLPSTKDHIVTFSYDLEMQAPLSENIIFELVNYSEVVRASILNFNTIRYE